MTWIWPVTRKQVFFLNFFSCLNHSAASCMRNSIIKCSLSLYLSLPPPSPLPSSWPLPLSSSIPQSLPSLCLSHLSSVQREGSFPSQPCEPCIQLLVWIQSLMPSGGYPCHLCLITEQCSIQIQGHFFMCIYMFFCVYVYMSIFVYVYKCAWTCRCICVLVILKYSFFLNLYIFSPNILRSLVGRIIK